MTEKAQICTGYDNCLIGGSYDPSERNLCSDCKHRDLSELAPQLEQYYRNGERVEVEWPEGWENWTGYGSRCEGKKGRFYIGMSTGWKPVYLTLYRRDSIGGGALYTDWIKSIRGLGTYKGGYRT